MARCFRFRFWPYPPGGGGYGDGLLTFSTTGPDRYASGDVVVDGECYALVWSPAGTSFGGFNADGTAARAGDRVVIAAALAIDGRCPEVIFQIPAEDAAAMDGGRYSVCLLDTRNVRGEPTGIGENGLPRRVNRWGVVSANVAASTEYGQALASTASASAKKAFQKAAFDEIAASACAGRLSSVPAGTPQPRITDIRIVGGTVRLEVEGTASFLTYGVASGETPDCFEPDSTAASADGAPGGVISFRPKATGESRFFKIVRSE